MVLCPIVFLVMSAAATPQSAMQGPVARIGADRYLVTNEYFTFGGSEQVSAAVSLVDVDADGDLDAVSSNGRHWARQDLILLNNGQGRFLRGFRLGDDLTTAYKPAVADFNGDGLPDIVAARDRLQSRLFLNAGAGQFSDAGPVGLAGPTRAAAAGDLDADGNMDIVLSNRGKQNQVLFGPDFKRSQWLAHAEQTVRVAIADLDQDGDPDLVFANLGSEGSIVYYNDGDGRFPQTQRISTSVGPAVDVAIADINGDDLPDLVFATIDRNAVLMNDKSNAFSRTVYFGSSNESSYAVAVGDLDNDSRVDIAIANAGSANAVFMNREDNLQRIDLPEPQGELSYDIEIGDVDGNGYPDLVIANSGSMNVTYLNLSDTQTDNVLNR